MKRLVAVLGIVVLSTGPAVVADANHTNAGQRLTHGEWSVPADHQYEAYEQATGRYVPIQATQVPDQLQAGAWIYDRTDNLWLQHPSVGKNPLYLAATAPAQGTTAAAAGWQRIHGTVQSIQGNTMTLRADDGRTITVDMARVNPNVHRAITNGEGVEVIGQYSPPTNQQHLSAQWIQQDSSNPGRGGRVIGSTAPSQPAPAAAPANRGKVDEQAWQRIHGQVQGVQGTTLRLKADDGRNITVDMSKVNANVRNALTQGEPVTVIGHYDNNRRHVDAQYIQQERAGGAASPRSDDRDKDRDDRNKNDRNKDRDDRNRRDDRKR
jgi:outer membrane lipoprotein SlyB